MAHPNIQLLRWFHFFLEFRLYVAIIVIYFAQVTGSYALAMSLFSITMISSAVLEIPTGIFSDIIGRKRTLILGTLASILFISFYAIGSSYMFLAIGAILEGLSRALWSGNNQALLYDSLAEEKKEEHFAEYMGKTQYGGQFALAICAGIGGFIAFFSFTLVLWLSVIPQIISLFIALKIREPKVHSVKSGNIYEHLGTAVKHFQKNYRLRLISLASIIRFSFGEAGFYFRQVFVNSLWPLWAVGFAQMGSHLFGSLSFYFSGKFITRFGALPSMVIEILSNRTLNFIALLFPGVWSPALMSLTSLAYGVGESANASLLHKEFTNEQRATLGSINALAGSIAFAIVAFGIGLIADNAGPIKTLLLVHVFLLLPLFIYWNIFHHEKKNRAV